MIRSVEINPNLYYVGVNDRQTHLFENMWPLEHGVSYNSYIIKSQKTALLDTVRVSKMDSFLKKVKEVLGDQALDYLVVHHMEPDHSGAIRAIIEAYPDVVLIGNKKTVEFLEAFYDVTENIQVVKEGDILDLGDHQLTFYMTPMVHWPESMVSYESHMKALFSQDAFGGFGALDGTIFDDEINWDFFESETRRYYTNIVGKFSRQVQAALKKLSALEIDMVLPVHGPVWRTNPNRIIELYDELSSYQVEEGVVIVYGSMYGNTEKMAETIARRLSENGIRNIQVFDVSKTHESYILNEIWRYRGVILGSCTYNNSVFPIMGKLLHVLESNKIENHVLGMFGSYSWSGGGLKYIQDFAAKGKYHVLETAPEVKCSPKADDLDLCNQLADEMSHILKLDRMKDLNQMLKS